MSGRLISERAYVDSKAELADGVEIGPNCYVGPGVSIDSGTKLVANVVVRGPCRIGKNNTIHPFASIGGDPQDLTWKGEPVSLEIGDDNVIYEFVTFNRGTLKEEGLTKIGSGNFLMAYVHIAHDCRVGNQTVLANNTTLAGHVRIDDYAICGGFTAVHQFCRIGSYAYLGHGGAVVRDVPPYIMVSDYPQRPRGINKVGLERKGFTPERIRRVREAFRVLYRQELALDEAVARLQEMVASDDPKGDVALITDFLSDSKRSIIR